MVRTIAGVLRGGTSSEYNLSLKSGAAMLSSLPEERYETRDILIDKNGMWYVRGLPTTPARALSQLDVVLNALHGGVGEDGTVQRILDRAGVAYTGARALPANLSLNKIRARQYLRKAGIRMPQAAVFGLADGLSTDEMARIVFSRIAPPYIVKPGSEGSGTGIRIAASVLDLPDAIGDVLDAFGAALVEQYLLGENVTAGILEKFRGDDVYAFPPAHVVLPEGADFFGPSIHEAATARYVVPSNFSREEKGVIAEMARSAHRALGLSHFSSADFILTRHGPYLLEVDAIPALHAGAALPPMLEAVGSSVREFLEHAIQLARSA